MNWGSVPGCGSEPRTDRVLSPVSGSVCPLIRVVSMTDWNRQRAEGKSQMEGQDPWSQDTRGLLGPVHSYPVNTRIQKK